MTFAVFCQGPYQESARYRDFMGWQVPWYSAMDSLQTLLAGRRVGRMHIVCYVREGSHVFETYWTTARGAEYRNEVLEQFLDNHVREMDRNPLTHMVC